MREHREKQHLYPRSMEQRIRREVFPFYFSLISGYDRKIVFKNKRSEKYKNKLNLVEF